MCIIPRTLRNLNITKLSQLLALLAFSIMQSNHILAAEPSKIVVGYYPGSPQVSMTGIIAAEQGFFREVGLDATLIPIANGPAMTAALASGSATFVNNSWDNLTVAMEQKLPIVGIAAATAAVPFQLYARTGVELPHLSEGYPGMMKDLVKLKWGVIIKGASLEFIQKELIRAAGFRAQDVTFISVGNLDTARPALKRGVVDIYLGMTPYTEIGTKEGEIRTVLDLSAPTAPEMFRGIGYNGWWATRQLVNDNPEIVKKFIAGLSKAFCWYRDPKNFDKVITISQKYLKVPGLDPLEYRSAVEKFISLWGVGIDARTIKTWSDMMLRNNQIKKGYNRSEMISELTPSDNPRCAAQ